MNDTYSAYLQSQAWEAKRKQRMGLSGFACEACGTKSSLQVHHLTYERIFQEDMDDLMTLCRIHHEAAEEMVRKGALKRTGCVKQLRDSTLLFVAPRVLHRPAKSTLPLVRKGKKPKKSKLEKRVHNRKMLEASRIWTPEAKKKIPAEYHNLTWTSGKEEVLPILLSDERFMAILGLPQKEFRRKYRKMFGKCPPRGRIFAVAGQLWIDVNRGKVLIPSNCRPSQDPGVAAPLSQK